ncbi:MAG: hypothetical protein HOP23_18960 [Methylococcaceae bacterium]|nr:hypothetical protein [Methylococcaceae bacterium]
MSDYAQARHTCLERVSSAMDGELKFIHDTWIPAIHAGKTIVENSD